MRAVGPPVANIPASRHARPLPTAPFPHQKAGPATTQEATLGPQKWLGTAADHGLLDWAARGLRTNSMACRHEIISSRQPPLELLVANATHTHSRKDHLDF